MPDDSLITKLTEFLGRDLSPGEATMLGAGLAAGKQGPAAFELLSELQDVSRKVASGAVQVLPHLWSLLPPAEVVIWLDLVVSLGGQSGAAAGKFCRESPDLLDALDSAARGPALQMALELAEQDANVALEGLRHAARVAAAAGTDVLPLWAQIGADLAKWDYVLGIEYFRRGPEILKVLSVEDLKPWAGISAKLVTLNSLGKPDYMAALAFFRTSPVLLGDLATLPVRRRVLSMARVLADRNPEKAIEFLGEAPGWLRRVRDPARQERVLQYGTLVAEQDAISAMAYLRRASEVIELIGPDAADLDERFEQWYRGGMEVLSYNHEAARAYFAVETRKALEAIEETMSGVMLRSIARMLKLFAEGLSGQSVTIRAHASDLAGESEMDATPRQTERGTISLPARMSLYRSREENFRVYKVLTAQEAGRLEYGTYDVPLERLDDLAAQACLRYGHPPVTSLVTLEELFRLYPNPMLVRDLWAIAEDARIEACLKAEYPGLRRDIESVAQEEVSKRSLTHGLTVREIVVELLLQLSAGDPDRVRVPPALEDVVGRAWALLQSVARPDATAEAVIRSIHRAYVLIEELTAGEAVPDQADTSVASDPNLEPRAGPEQGGSYQPVTTFAHRGAMDAERVRGMGEQVVQERSEWNDLDEGPGGIEAAPAGHDRARGLRSLQEATPGTPAPSQTTSPSLADEMMRMPGDGTGLKMADHPGARAFLYDEWDGMIQDYRARWCRVLEQAAPEGTEAFVERTRNVYGGVINLIRRYFEGIRPPAFRRVRRQADGEEVDIEAAVERLIERRAGVSPSDFVYVRRDRRDRDVAAAFLVDLSGSTGQQIGPDSARIIDVEKEGLVLLCEALEAIGDQYAVYGYSGQSRGEVQILILKDFDERYGPQVWRRIDAVRPMSQNRDGAAIRHVLTRLSARAARVKLLILLSDGRPLDDGYQDDYALEDTKAALQEAKARGIHPFCITVDAEAPGYLTRMYGEVRYLIIDRVQSLPERLPKIYRTLTT